MSIKHIEDLPITDLIHVLENMKDYDIREKMDGANLGFGIDDSKKLFTSRELKNSRANRIYKATDWPNTNASTQFQAAHLALEQQLPIIQAVLEPNDLIQIEVMFSNQPNTVNYNKDDNSYIVLINTLLPEKVSELVSKLKTTESKVEVLVPASSDGKTITSSKETFTFKFIEPVKIDNGKIPQSVVQKTVKDLKEFLSKTTDSISNETILCTPLNKIDAAQREKVKQIRAQVQKEVDDSIILPFKKELLEQFIHKLPSELSNDQFGIEGVVLTNGDSVVKIVDKDLFTKRNEFNQSFRKQISSTIKSTDPNAELELKGGLIGDLKLKMADLLGNIEWAHISKVAAAIEDVKGETTVNTIKNFAEELAKHNPDYQGVRIKMLSLIKATKEALEKSLEEFSGQEHQLDEYKMTDTVKGRTLLSYAEAVNRLSELYKQVDASHTYQDFVKIQYGPIVSLLHGVEPVEEMKGSNQTLSWFNHKSAFYVVSSYLSTCLISWLIFEMKDGNGLAILDDRRFLGLKKFNRLMSPLNFAGYVTTQYKNKDVFSVIGKDTANDLNKIFKRIPKQYVTDFHFDFSNQMRTKIKWKQHETYLKKIMKFSHLNLDRIENLFERVKTYNELSADEQKKCLHDLIFYSAQFINKSILYRKLLRMEGTQMKKEVVEENFSLKKLLEDEGAANSVTSTMATSADVAKIEQPIFKDGKKIVRRRRNPSLKFYQFKKDTK
jgi:hypothetical protein